VDKGLVLVHAIDHQSSPPSYVVDCVVSYFFNSRSLDNDVKTVWIVFFEFGPLVFWILSIELDILVRSIELFGDVHFDTFVRSKCDFARSIQFEKLGEDEAGGSCTNQENLDTNWGIQLVQPVNGTCGRFEERRLFVGEVMDLIKLLLRTVSG